jgi:metal-sulfur cluster biosynthetic enzyme
VSLEVFLQSIKETLSQVIDPETGLSIMRMDLIHDLRVSTDGSVSMVFRPSSPVCPMAYALGSSIKKRVEAIDRVTSVTIKVENFRRAEHLESVLKQSKPNS